MFILSVDNIFKYMLSLCVMLWDRFRRLNIQIRLEQDQRGSMAITLNTFERENSVIILQMLSSIKVIVIVKQTIILECLTRFKALGQIDQIPGQHLGLLNQYYNIAILRLHYLKPFPSSWKHHRYFVRSKKNQLILFYLFKK